ncbi:MAG: MiaB/RimO family radical SAM methylthiotransferase [Acidobacteriota bacterium]
MTYAILTFGCRVNQADSFALDAELRMRGALEAPADSADLVIVNTCSVTGAADQSARRAIRGLSRDNPSARIVVTGCYATRQPDDLKGLGNVRLIVPNRQKDDLLSLLADQPDGILAGEWGLDDTGSPGALTPGALGRTACPLRVQTGCNESCAFCIIPSTRGVSRSRPLADIRRDVQRVSDAGFREVWIVGVHLGSYGRDLDAAGSLAALLRELATTDGDVVFRLGSLEPMDCTADVVDVLIDSSRFAPHLHLPVQHANNRVLRAMRRPYGFEQFSSLVETVHARMPQASIGTDVIVGFPGETDRDVDDMATALEALPLSYLHVFPYSDRPGTDASAMTAKVDPPAIKARAAITRRVAAGLHERFVQTQVGTIRPGLTIDDGATVMTDNFLKVRILPGLPRNTRVDVRIDSAALDGTVRGRDLR